MTAQPNVVKEFNIGNTRIKIADNYCSGKSQEDIKKALREIARKAQASLTAAAVSNGYV